MALIITSVYRNIKKTLILFFYLSLYSADYKL